MKNNGLYIVGGVVGTIAVAALAGFGMVVSTSNGAVRLESQVDTAKANINKEQNRRVTLFNNMVDAVESYNKYEGDTLNKITKARTEAKSGDVEKAKVALSAVVEKYPDLKSQKNYAQTLTEFSSTENRLADYTEAYNNDVRSYNNYTRTFPRAWFLSMSGHVVQTYKQSEMTVNPSDATNLFGK